MSFLFVPMTQVTLASADEFSWVVGIFQPGLTRLLTYKGIDSLAWRITDPIRASTPLFSAAMAIVFLGEEITFADRHRHIHDHQRHHAVVMASRRH
jgi:drug/metabolite transporter (DMT)-like permease